MTAHSGAAGPATAHRAARSALGKIVATSAACLVAGLLLRLSSPAAAQTTALQVDRFVPAQGPGAFLQTEGGQVPGRFALSGGLSLVALSRPLELRTAEVTPLSTPVRERVALDLALELGLPAHLSIGIGVPIMLWQDGDRRPTGAVEALPQSAVGDIRVRGKASLLPDAWPVALGLLLELTVPGGGQAGFAATPGPTFATRVLFSGSYRWLAGAADLGARFSPRRDLYDATFGHHLEWSAALAATFLAAQGRRPGLALLAEVAGSIDPIIDPAPSRVTYPSEARAALRLRVARFTVDAGAGAGLSDEPTAPAWRALLLLRAPLYGGPRAPPAQIFSGP